MTLTEIIISSVLGALIVAFVVMCIVHRKKRKKILESISALSSDNRMLEKNQYELNRMLVVIENMIKNCSQDIKRIRSTFDKSVAPLVGNKAVIDDLGLKLTAAQTSMKVMQDTIAHQERELAEYQRMIRENMQK